MEGATKKGKKKSRKVTKSELFSSSSLISSGCSTTAFKNVSSSHNSNDSAVKHQNEYKYNDDEKRRKQVEDLKCKSKKNDVSLPSFSATEKAIKEGSLTSNCYSNSLCISSLSTSLISNVSSISSASSISSLSSKIASKSSSILSSSSSVDISSNSDSPAPSASASSPPPSSASTSPPPYSLGGEIATHKIKTDNSKYSSDGKLYLRRHAEEKKEKQLRGHIYSNRPASRLDHFAHNSPIAQSEYRGFANLFSIVSIFYVIGNPILTWYDKNEFVDPSLAKAMFDDFFSLMFMWLKLTVWSFSAYYFHILYMKRKINRLILSILQHTTQSLSIFYAVGHCLYNQWPIIPAGFVQMLAVISFMKMHSFTMTNLYFNDAMGTEEANPIYPKNINLKNFCYYVFCPALVYEPEYPRGPGFRVWYFFWKICSMVGAMMTMYLVCTSCIIPTTINSVKSSFIETFTRLMFPLLMVDMLIFYILFECICNLFAEVTNFGDRDFYQDWWNSTTWDEYSRKWNRPVYEFLLRHVYLETLQKFQWSQRDATMATFLFSACIHEMIMGVCFRIVRMYLFLMMLFQIPLIAVGRNYRGTVFGNMIFWAGLMLGVPLLAVAYGREWARINFLNGEDHPLKFF